MYGFIQKNSEEVSVSVNIGSEHDECHVRETKAWNVQLEAAF